MEKYRGVRIIKNIGINTSYWNAANYSFRKINDVYFVDNQPLIIYHFSSLRKESDDYMECLFNLWIGIDTKSAVGDLSDLHKAYRILWS